jgi:hypothetical protein
MPIINTSELKDARTNRFAPSWGGGIGYEFYQMVMGAVVGLIIAVLLWFLGLKYYGLGVAIAGGIGFAMWPNYMNTRHKDPKRYIRDEVRKRTQYTLIVNDQRRRDLPDTSDDFVAEVSEFPSHYNEREHV